MSCYRRAVSVGGDHGGKVGGRLYCTAMAAMTLEVYYRDMPIYAGKSHDIKKRSTPLIDANGR